MTTFLLMLLCLATVLLISRIILTIINSNNPKINYDKEKNYNAYFALIVSLLWSIWYFYYLN